MFSFFKKNKDNESDEMNRLLDIPCDYDGYDFVGNADKTNPHLYEEITSIFTNGKLDINYIPIYKELKVDSNQEGFDYFYDEWIEYLEKNNYICHLEHSDGIKIFAENINKILKNKGIDCNININEAIEIYRQELDRIKVNPNLNYDILIANVTASLLRKNGLELIALFNGFDNNCKTVISNESIPILKEIEGKMQ